MSYRNFIIIYFMIETCMRSFLQFRSKKFTTTIKDLLKKANKILKIKTKTSFLTSTTSSPQQSRASSNIGWTACSNVVSPHVFKIKCVWNINMLDSLNTYVSVVADCAYVSTLQLTKFNTSSISSLQKISL
jgi:hypothetical protein